MRSQSDLRWLAGERAAVGLAPIDRIPLLERGPEISGRLLILNHVGLEPRRPTGMLQTRGVEESRCHRAIERAGRHDDPEGG